MRLAAVVAIAASTVVVSPVLAQADLPAQTPASPRLNKLDVYFGLGSFKPQSDAKLTGRSGSYSLALGFGSRYSRHIAWEIEYLSYGQDVDTPAGLKKSAPLTSVSDNAHISTWGIGGIAKLVQPIGPFDAYAGAGLGYYSSELKAFKTTLFFIPDEVKRKDRRFGTQFVAGIDLPYSDMSIWSVQYRKLILNADFGPDIGDVGVGGSMWQISYRKFF